MSDLKESKEDKNVEKNSKQSFNNLKKIRKSLMSFAKDEILDIKKSKKDINIANFENQEIIAPSKYSLTTKALNFHYTKSYSENIEPVQEKVINNKNGDNKGNKNDNNNEISSSDISDDE